MEAFTHVVKSHTEPPEYMSQLTRVTIALLTASICRVSAVADPNASFSALAVSTISPEWPKLQPALEIVTKTLLPNNTSLHDTRKTVLLVHGVA